MPCQVCESFSTNNDKCAQCGFDGNDILFLNQEQARYWMEHHVVKFRKELFEKLREEIAEKERQLQASVVKNSELETLVKSREAEIQKLQTDIEKLKNEYQELFLRHLYKLD